MTPAGYRQALRGRHAQPNGGRAMVAHSEVLDSCSRVDLLMGTS